MVPSWTETLLAAGVNVVGRTRYCVHPKELTRQIPAVGGTKDWDLSALETLSADLVVLDKEENPKWMSEQSPIPWIATHVQSAESVSGEIDRLAGVLSNSELTAMAARWGVITKMRPRSRALEFLPGVQKWIRKPVGPVSTFLYLIWRRPLMAVSQGTFIGSVFELATGGLKLPDFSQKYPEINLDQFDPSSTLLLCSTEPFPFQTRERELGELGFPVAIVNGEDFSWFGVRTLKFLESLR